MAAVGWGIVAVVCILFGNVLRALVLLLVGWPLLFGGRQIRRYYINQLIADDQTINAACGGDPDETISSRLGKARHTSRTAAFFAVIVDFLFWWQGPNHTDNSEEPDEGGNAVL